MEDIALYLILALVISPVSVVALCFVGKLIKLRREYTELLIPIIGALIFLFIFQTGLVSLVEKFNLGSFFHLTYDIIVSVVISQAIYVFCRKFGSKSTAAKRHWIFIGITFFLTVLFVVVAAIILVPMPVQDASKLVKNFLIDGAYIIPNAFIVLLFVFILIAFNMVLYKLTKEISFAIRRKRG